MHRRTIAITQASAVILASALISVLAKLALRDVPAFTFVWLQLAIGGSALTLYTFAIQREHIPRGLPRHVWVYLVLMGLGNFVVVRLLFMHSLERLPATTHAYLVNFVGIVTMFMSVFILRERPSGLQVVGAAIAVVGVRVFFPEVPPPAEWTGVVYVGVGILVLALTNNIARKLVLATSAPPPAVDQPVGETTASPEPHRQPSNNIISTLALWIGGLPVVAAGLVTDWPPRVVGWRNWGIVVLAGVVGIAIGSTVWNHILRTLRSYEASILAASAVVFTALLAIPILGESLTPHKVAGIGLLLLGIALVQLRRTT